MNYGRLSSQKESALKTFHKDLSLCRGWLDYLALWGAVGGGLGYLPRAPGTWGSLPGLLAGALIFHGGSLWEGSTKIVYYGAVTLVLVLWAYWSLARVERMLGAHDEGRFVADEVVGQTLACFFVEPRWSILVAAFFCFRIFDILKPGPIGFFDREVPGPWGTLLDDVLAGVVSGVIIFLGVWIGLL